MVTQSTPTSTDTRMSAAERREQILRCAIELVESSPFTEVSVDAVAERAGVTRTLVHHYFGTRRGLYLEAVRRLYTIPETATDDLGGNSPLDRVPPLVERWLEGVWEHRTMWIATVTGPGPGADPEVAEIIRAVDRDLAGRALDALGLVGHPDIARLEAVMMTFAALAKQSSQEWLQEGALTRDDVRRLLIATLGAIVTAFG